MIEAIIYSDLDALALRHRLIVGMAMADQMAFRALSALSVQPQTQKVKLYPGKFSREVEIGVN
jgi:hypothetical protein